MKKLTLVCLCLLAVAACGPQQANVTPQAAVAHYGADIVQGLTTYQSFLIKATEGPTPTLTVEQAKPRMDEVRKGLAAAQRLSTLLKSYDSLTTTQEKQAIVPQIQEALNALATLGLDAATLPAQLVNEGTRLANNVASIIAAAKVAISSGGL